MNYKELYILARGNAKAKGITVAQIASHVGVTERTIMNWANTTSDSKVPFVGFMEMLDFCGIYAKWSLK